jgi:spore coat protein U-like protein
MKKILLPLVAASTILAAASAGAVGTNTITTPSFNVTVNLTSACTITTPAAVAFNYTSLQTSPASPTAGSGAFSVTCTNSLPYTLALNSTSGTFATVGLNYTLSLSAAGGTGNGSAQSYSVGGSIAANQSGNCAVASCSDTATHTLTITY